MSKKIDLSEEAYKAEKRAWWEINFSDRFSDSLRAWFFQQMHVRFPSHTDWAVRKIIDHNAEAARAIRAYYERQQDLS